MAGEANVGGDGGEAGPSQTMEQRLAEVFKSLGGASGAEASQAATLLQRMVEETRQTVLAESEKRFEARLAAEREKLKEKKRKRREEKQQPTPEETLTPRAREKKLRREARAVERQRAEEERKREADRALRPKLVLNPGGAPEPKSYRLFRSQLGQIMRANFRITEYWATKSEQEKFQIREQVKDRFNNGHFLDDRFLNKRISLSLNDRRNHMREKMRNYLLDSPGQTPEELKAGDCPGGLDPDGWAAWLDAELSIRA
jgi:hypothetical protein